MLLIELAASLAELSVRLAEVAASLRDVEDRREPQARALAEAVLKSARNTLDGLAGTAALSPRQSEVLAELLQGLSEKQIAVKLGISRHTVHVYVKALHKRFDVTARGELLSLFICQGDDKNQLTPASAAASAPTMRRPPSSPTGRRRLRGTGARPRG